jgi:selenocysteine lyase/cysteine desulfurase
MDIENQAAAGSTEGNAAGGGDPWARFRAQMPVAQGWAYFDHAAVAPLCQGARKAMAQCIDDATENGDANSTRWANRLEEVRGFGAELLAADPAEVALVRNTTEGINFVAEGFPWREGDNVVTPADEFPSNQYPWINLAARGVETRRVKSDEGRVSLDALAAACDERTRLIAVSWVGYASGWRSDVDALVELAHRRGAYLFLDAIQGLGAFPLDAHRSGVDFLSADGHKWLLGPEGAGLFYLRREHLDLLRPMGVGWHSVVHSGDFNRIELTLRPSASRYEGGTYNVAGLVGMGASLELLREFGPVAIGKRLLEITDLTCRRLEGIGARITSHRERPEHSSGIVSFELPQVDPLAVRKACLARGVVLSCRAGRLRVSPHAYTNDDDIERLVAALRALQ